MNAQVLDLVRTVAADVLGVRCSDIHVESSPEHFDNWDSISHVSMIVAIEEQFGVEFSPEEITTMGSIGTIADLLSRKLDNGHPH